MPRILAIIRKCLLVMALIMVVLPLTVIFLLRWLPPPTSAFMLQRQFENYAVAGCRKIDYQWQPRSRISSHMALSAIAAEDQHFPEHWGFDTHAIYLALKEKHAGKRLRGASTISQQVAKNLFLWPGRSWLRKAIEVWLTAWIEILWPKQRIIEVYLNVAQFGACLFGTEAASQKYFHHHSKDLNAHEAALLAAVLPNPVFYQVSRPSQYILKRQRWILQQARQLGGIRFLQRLSN